MTFQSGQQVLGYRVDSLLSAEGASVARASKGAQRVLLVRLPADLPGVHIAAREADWLAKSRLAVHGLTALDAPIGLGAQDEVACAVYPLNAEPWAAVSGLPISSVLERLAELAAALATLHDQGLFHGAIRRELLSFDAGRARLAGAGLVDLASELGGPRLVRDSLPLDFRPPELRGDNPPVAAAWGDVFAIGVLMAELLAGRSAQGEDRPTPRALGASVPDWVEQQVALCVSTRIYERPRDLREWWQVLRELSERGGSEALSAPVRNQPVAASLPAPHPGADTSQSPADASVGVEDAAHAPAVAFKPPLVHGKLPHMPLVPAAPRVAPASAVPKASGVPEPPIVPQPSAVPPAGELPPPSWLAPKPKVAFQPAGASPARVEERANPEDGFTPPPGVVSMVHHGEPGAEPAPPAAQPEGPLSRSVPGRPVYEKQAEPGLRPAPAQHDTLGFNVAAGKQEIRELASDGAPVDELGQRVASPLAPSWQQSRVRPPSEPELQGPPELASAAGAPSAGPEAAPESAGAAGAPSAAPVPAPTNRRPPTPDSAVSAAERRGHLMIRGGVVMAALLLVVGIGVIFALKGPSPPPTAPSAALTADAGAVPTLPLPDPHGLADAGASAPGADAGAGGAGSEEADAGPLPRMARGAGAAEFTTAAANDAAALLPLGPYTPTWGDASAPATLVVFGDLDCKHTRRLFRVLEQLKRDFGADLRLAWVHTPLRTHAHSQRAAELSAALARSVGSAGFWKTLEEWAHSADPPTDGALEGWASAAGYKVSAPSLAGDADAKRNVTQDRTLGVRFGVRSTPTIYLNGLLIEGFNSRGVMYRLVQSEVSAVRSLRAQGVSPQVAYLTRVKKNLIDVGEAIPARVCPAVLDAPVLGKADALVTIVEFSDFECQSCAEVQPTLRALSARYAGDLRLIWKHLPLGVHERARPAATLAIEAQLQLGDAGFWKAHDALFAAQADLSEAALLGVAKKIGLPATALDAVRADKRRPRIESDIREADRVGARGTPSFYINGRLLEGAQPISKFRELVNAELKAAKLLVASGTARQDIYDTLCGRP